MVGERSEVPLEFCLPAIAEAEAEGFVVNWFKDEGQAVKAGELLLEVQFEKVTTEIQAPQDGVIGKILCPQGEAVRVGQPLCTILEQGEVKPDSEAATPKETSAPVQTPREIRATPAAKRLARSLGIDLTHVPGTGPGGRIGEKDVKAFAERASQTAKLAEGEPVSRREPLSPAQRVTGERMLQSLRETAQFTLGREVDVTALVALRARAKETGSLVTLSDLIHRAVVLALAEHPRLQAQLEGSDLVMPETVNLGIAVARGADLLVPVIMGAQNLGLNELAAERRRLTRAVLEGRVAASDLQGATFTVSNLGAFGIDFFTPVLNPPQSAILGIGRTVERPVFKGRTIQPAHFIALSLTVDHRVINGSTGAEFLATLAKLLAAPEGWASFE